jgi:hypothetical protein
MMARGGLDKLKSELQNVEETVILKLSTMHVVIYPFPSQRQQSGGAEVLGCNLYGLYVDARLLSVVFTVYTVNVLGTRELPIREIVLSLDES